MSNQTEEEAERVAWLRLREAHKNDGDIEAAALDYAEACGYQPARGKVLIDREDWERLKRIGNSFHRPEYLFRTVEEYENAIEAINAKLEGGE